AVGSVLVGNASTSAIYIGGNAIVGNSGTNATMIVKSTGAQTYNTPTTLGANTTLNSTGGGNITINGTLDGAQTLVVNTAGNSTFSGIVGGTTPLTSLATDAAGNTVIGANITTSNQQTFSDAVALSGDAKLSTTNSSVTFVNTVNSASGKNLTIDAGT